MTSVSYLVLALFVLLLAGAIKYYMVFIRGPKRVRRTLDGAFYNVADLPSIGERRSGFLERWEERVAAENCPPQIAGMDSSGFIGDTFFVWYTDSVEFPGLPTFRTHFTVRKPMFRDQD